jgi:hypothetical protein
MAKEIALILIFVFSGSEIGVGIPGEMLVQNDHDTVSHTLIHSYLHITEELRRFIQNN